MPTRPLRRSRHPSALCWGGWLGLLVLCAPVLGAHLRLPLEGYYRAGRYMPVAIQGQGPMLNITGADILPTLVDTTGDPLIVPVLVFGPGPLEVQTVRPIADGLPSARGTLGGVDPAPARSRPLRELQPDQRLIATLLDDPPPSLFPTMRPILIRLEASALLHASPAAWGALDALVLDRATYQQLALRQISDFLSAGTLLAVRADRAPDDRWPWRKEGSYWRLSSPLDGPVSAGPNEAAYRPTFSWSGDWPPAFRRRLLIAAAAFILLVLLGALLPRRWRLGAVGGVSLAAVGLILWWRTAHAPLLQLNGTLLADHGSMRARDHWFYQTTPDPRSAAFHWRDWTLPLFAAPQQRRSLHMSLRCDSAGQPIGFEYRLPPRSRIAFLSRSIVPAAPALPLQPARPTPLRDLARQLYLHPENHIAGQLPPAPDATWPTLVLQGSPKATPDDAQTPHAE